MKINTILSLNNLKIKKLLIFVFVIQIAFLSLIALDSIGIKIPILRQVISFIDLALIPGLLILRILRLHELDTAEMILLAVGLSITSIMFIGFFINMIFPLIGIQTPLSLFYLSTVWTFYLLVLCVISYLIDRDYDENLDNENTKFFISPVFLSLCLLPFFAIFGAYLMNNFQNNILFILMFLIISLTPILVISDKFISKELYPATIFIISISLILSSSLISSQIWGWDIHYEYYFANLTIQNSFWNYLIHFDINGMLSVVILAPVFSILTDLSLTWVVKLIYPVLFSLISIGLYNIFQKQTNDKIAFLSTFFFMTFYVFFIDMVSLARQEIAELFLVMFILVLINNKIRESKKAVLLILFSISIAVSHYGLSYFFLILVILAWIFLYFAPKIVNHLKKVIPKYFYNKFDSINFSENRTVKNTFLVLFVVFTISWYIYISTSASFNTFVHLVVHFVNSVSTDFLDPENIQGLGIALERATSPLRDVNKYLIMFSQLLIVLGLIKVFLSGKKMKFNLEYIAFSLASLIFLIASLTVPVLASNNAMATQRVYHLALIFLSPFCVIGGIWLFILFNKLTKRNWQDVTNKSFKFLSVIFAIMLIFNSGLIYQIANDNPVSITLSQKSVDNGNDLQTKGILYTTLNVFPTDVYSSSWFNNRVVDRYSTIIYADRVSMYSLVSYAGKYNSHRISLNENMSLSDMKSKSYLFVTYPNLIKKVGVYQSTKIAFQFDNENMIRIMNSTNLIYSNGGSAIYLNN